MCWSKYEERRLQEEEERRKDEELRRFEESIEKRADRILADKREKEKDREPVRS